MTHCFRAPEGSVRLQIAAALALIIVVAASGCEPGNGSDETAAAQAGPVLKSSADLIRPDDPRLVVAKVNDIPIYADCVERQAVAHQLSAAAALDECISFELLAQAAFARGLASNRDVIESWRLETARAFIDKEFAERIASGADLPKALVNAAYDKYLMRFQRPEYRVAVYVRAEIPKKNKDPLIESAAKTLAMEIYSAVADKRNMTADELYAFATEVAGQRPIAKGPPFDFPLRGRAVPEFADAAFSIPEPGRVAPPVRTKWGWDVILLTDILEAVDIDRATAAEQMFEALRPREFLAWTSRLSDAHTIEMNEPAFELLADVDDVPPPAAVPGPRPGPAPGATPGTEAPK